MRFMPMITECKRLTTAVQQIDNLKVNLLLSYLPWYKEMPKILKHIDQHFLKMQSNNLKFSLPTNQNLKILISE